MDDELAASGVQLPVFAANPRPAAGARMKVFVGLCLISAGFGLVVGVTYFFVAHEETAGTAMLGFMTVALTFCGGYAIVAERNADLVGDAKDATPQSAAGVDLGI